MLRVSKLYRDGRWRQTPVLALAIAVTCGLWASWQGGGQAAAQVAEQGSTVRDDSSAIDLTYVAADAAVIKVIRPAAMLQRTDLGGFRRPLDQAVGLLTGLEIGIDDLEQVTWMVLKPKGTPRASQPVSIDLVVLALQASGPHDFTGFIGRWIDGAEKKEIHGRTYYVGKAEGRPVAYFRPDERSAVLGSEEAVLRVIETPGGRPPEFLAPETWAEFKDDHLFVAGRSDVVDAILKWPELALTRAAIASISPLWMETISFAHGVRIEDRLDERIVAFAKDEAGALRIEETFGAMMTITQNLADGLREPFDDAPPWMQSLRAIAVDIATDMRAHMDIDRSGTVVRYRSWTDAPIFRR